MCGSRKSRRFEDVIFVYIGNVCYLPSTARFIQWRFAHHRKGTAKEYRRPGAEPKKLNFCPDFFFALDPVDFCLSVVKSLRAFVNALSAHGSTDIEEFSVHSFNDFEGHFSKESSRR